MIKSNSRNNNNKEPLFLVLGGTGHYGRHIVDALLKNGKGVRVMSRNETRAKEILSSSSLLEIVQGDVLSKESIEMALQGVSGVVISIASIGWKASRHRMLVERDAVLDVICTAERLGIKRIVYISGYDVQEGFVKELGIEDIARPMLDVQQALKESKTLNWTILGCPPSMELFFSMLSGNVMNVPGGGPPCGIPSISPKDVGKIAAQSVVRDDLGGQHFRMAGCPKALTFDEAAKIIGDTWNQSIRVRRIPLAPIKIAASLTRPFSPYLQQIVNSLALLNFFPQELIDQIPQDHQRLLETFDYTPTTLVEEARERMQ